MIPRKRSLGCSLWKVTLMVGSIVSVTAQNARCQDWVTEARLEQVLAEVDPLSLSEGRIKDGIQTLQEVYKVCIFLDRTVDPNQRISIKTPPLPLRDRIQQLAESANLGCAILDWGIYLGPPEISSTLATLTELQKKQIREGDRTTARRLLTERPWAWKQPSEPRQILKNLAKEFRVTAEGVDQLPHDLWAGRTMPDMDFPSALTLTLAGFRSSYQWKPGGNSIQVIAYPRNISLTETYRLKTSQSPPIEVWKKEFPMARLRIDGRLLAVDGPSEIHKQVRDWISGKPARPRQPTDGAKALTLKIKSATLKQATDYLGTQLGLEFEFSEKASEKLEERIAIDVTDVSLEELLQEVLKPLALTFEIKDQRVSIQPVP